MARHSVNSALFYVSFVHEWLDSIDAGPHPMDPNRGTKGVRQYLASGAIAELAKVATDLGDKRRLGDLARRIAREGIAGLQTAADDDDEQTDWHPPIPKWGGGPDFAATAGRWGWLNTLPAPVLAGLVNGAAASIKERVQASGSGRGGG